MKKLAITTAALIAAGVVAYTLTVKATAPPAASHIQTTSLPQQSLPAVQIKNDAFGDMATPQTLFIPSFGISSSVVAVGLTADGAMDIPDNLQDTGWYNKSVNPGNPGRAVMAVHTGYPNKPSKFRQLEALQPGATLQVKDQAGKTATFSVIETKSYPAHAAPTHIIFGDSPTARLNLITCTGEWDAANNSYTHRLVIFAARVE